MKKLAILGMATTWKNAPFDKPDEWEFWALNEMYNLAFADGHVKSLKDTYYRNWSYWTD